jgi:hypothetical protein
MKSSGAEGTRLPAIGVTVASIVNGWPYTVVPLGEELNVIVVTTRPLVSPMNVVAVVPLFLANTETEKLPATSFAVSGPADARRSHFPRVC